MKFLKLSLFFLVISILPVWKTGTFGILNHGDTFFPFFPDELFFRLKHTWYEFYLLGQENLVILSYLPLSAIVSGLHLIGVNIQLVNRVFFILPLFMMATSIYYLTSILYQEKDKDEACILATLFFVFNPLIKDQLLGGSIAILFTRAVGVFMLALIIRGLQSLGEKRYLFCIAFTSFFLAVNTIVGIITIILVTSYVVYYLFDCYSEKQKFNNSVKFSIIAALIILLINFWWILPVSLRVLSSTSGFVSDQLGESKGIDLLKSTAFHTNILYVIRMMYGYITLENVIFTYERTFVGPLCVIILVLCAYSIILFRSFKQLKRDTKYFYLMAIIASLFSTGVSNNLFKIVYTTIWDYVPLFHIFRNPMKFTCFSSIAYAYLVGFFWLILRNSFLEGVNKKLIITSYWCFIVIILIGGWPLLTGNVLGFLKPVYIPKSYDTAKKFLQETNNEQRLFILPNENWYTQYNWAPYDMADIAISYFSIPTVSNYPGLKKIDEGRLDGLVYKEIYEQDGKNNDAIRKILRLCATKYIMLHRDTMSSSIEIRKLYEKLRSLNGVSYERCLKGMDFYLIRSPLPRVYATEDLGAVQKVKF